MKWEKYQFEQYVQVVMLTWRAQMWALQIRFVIPVEGWRGVGRDPRGARAVTFQWQRPHLFCLILCPRGPLLPFWGHFWAVFWPTLAPAHFFNCLIQSNDLEGWFCGPQIHCITCRAPVTTRCFGCFLSLMTGATLKCKQFSCDLADEKVKNWGPPNVPPFLTEFETLKGTIKERCWVCRV